MTTSIHFPNFQKRKWKIPAYSDLLKLWSCGIDLAKSFGFNVSPATEATNQQFPSSPYFEDIRTLMKMQSTQKEDRQS